MLQTHWFWAHCGHVNPEQFSQQSLRLTQKAPTSRGRHVGGGLTGHVGVDTMWSMRTLHPLRALHTPLRHTHLALRPSHAALVMKPQ
mgnify:CR=1 FL=1